MHERMIKPWLMGASLALLLGVAAACGSADVDEETNGTEPSAAIGQRVETGDGFYVDVSPKELQSMLGSKDFPLVNVHIPYGGEIVGTDLFIPYDEMAQRLGELPSDLDSKIVIYCRSGSMSADAAKALVGLGYTNVWNLDGGMIAWEDAGYPLLQASE
jgi:rhodanese-related sulfurtransferase